MNRREFVVRAAAAGALVVASGAGAQDTTQSSNLGAMNQGASRSVRRPPKPGATPSMTDRERDENVERKLHCQCGCTLDVYTCRTTDFACQVSPAMHADVKALVEGGYSAQEILDSFVDTYGERALMAPRAEGFNLFGYVAPFIAFAAGAVAVGVVLKNWGSKRNQPAVAGAPPIAASSDELARLDAAIRDDS